MSNSSIPIYADISTASRNGAPDSCTIFIGDSNSDVQEENWIQTLPLPSTGYVAARASELNNPDVVNGIVAAVQIALADEISFRNLLSSEPVPKNVLLKQAIAEMAHAIATGLVLDNPGINAVDVFATRLPPELMDLLIRTMLILNPNEVNVADIPCFGCDKRIAIRHLELTLKSLAEMLKKSS